MLSYIEISQKNLLHNAKQFRKLAHPDTRVVGVIKANAYGHGQNEVAQILEPAVDYFQVDDLLELRLLRRVTHLPILVLGYVAKDELEAAIKLNGTLAVYDLERLSLIEKIGKRRRKKVPIHVKIDAELGRQGLVKTEWPAFIAALKRCRWIKLDALYSHFANIEDTSDFSHAQKQIDCFSKAVEQFQRAGFTDFATHQSASSGVMVYEKGEGINKIIRPGLSIYGMWPSEELRERFEGQELTLRPVMRWVSHVAQVKKLPKGHSIGYGLTFVTPRAMKVAVIPQGYSDGYDRGLSSKGEVLISGKRCRVLGRVAMNMFVVDVTKLPKVKAEDEVVLLGEQGKERITAEELAEKIGTINYEITTRITSLLPRIIK
ncbi:alanine racemase [Candidatus Falkowbacteria bacterium]|nr:alanine racemase [Candidatus Falkowbacteria bacterium]